MHRKFSPLRTRGDEGKKTTSQILDINNPHSPYYLCTFDHPGNIISPIILNGDNYANWNRIVSSALKSKNKFCFVDGSLARPEIDSPEGYVWEKCNSMVIAWLYNVIDKNCMCQSHTHNKQARIRVT